MAACQAILAAQRRRNAQKDSDENLGSPVNPGSPIQSEATRARERSRMQQSLKRAIKAQEKKLFQLFSIWDLDGNGHIDRAEFRRALTMLGIKAEGVLRWVRDIYTE